MERLVLRMGEFHTAMAYLSCIGKIFADAGLHDILLESDVVATGSIDGVITGHHYNRSLRAHKLMMEALQRLRWWAYLDTLTQEDHAATLQIATDLQQKFPSEDFNAMLSSDAFLQLLEGYDIFVNKNSTNQTFTFWSTYIEMMENLLQFIRATREGNWPLCQVSNSILG